MALISRPFSCDSEPRLMQAHDIATVMQIQAACYGDDFLEAAGVLLQRLQSAGNTCWVASHQGQVHAYLAAYRSVLGQVTPLHGAFQVGANPDTLYLHDLAVRPAASGMGLGSRLIHALLNCSSNKTLSWSALVAVQEAHEFWAKYGYSVHEPDDPLQREHLASYGPHARYMVRRLTAA